MSTGARGAYPTRQARQRAATYDAIVAAARKLIAAGQELTLRGVAGSMGVSPAGLYRYVAHLDELRDLVAVSIDESPTHDIAAAVTEVMSLDASVRWVAGWIRLRSWALSHPDEFRLVVSRPRSGQSPIRALSDAYLGELLRELADQHKVVLPPVPLDAEPALRALAPCAGPEPWPASLTWLHARVLTSLHGVIALEVTGYVEPAFVASAAVFRSTLVDWLARFGLVHDLGRLLAVLDAELVR
jgi:AcrR family transcriptional regulator